MGGRDEKSTVIHEGVGGLKKSLKTGYVVYGRSLNSRILYLLGHCALPHHYIIETVIYCSFFHNFELVVVSFN